MRNDRAVEKMITIIEKIQSYIKGMNRDGFA